MTQVSRILRRVISAALLLLLRALCAAPSYSQIPATDDAYVTLASPTTNVGLQPPLLAGPGETTFIRFDLSTLPSGLTAANVSKANLRLYINVLNAAGSFEVYLVNSAWSEMTITYNNAPAFGQRINIAPIQVWSTRRDFLDVDVTSAVQAWLNTGNNYGIELIASAGSTLSVSFDSKENTSTSHDPELNVESVSAGPQGPVGPQGPQGPQGLTGPAGASGAAASVQVGTTMTVPARTSASVLNGAVRARPY